MKLQVLTHDEIKTLCELSGGLKSGVEKFKKLVEIVFERSDALKAKNEMSEKDSVVIDSLVILAANIGGFLLQCSEAIKRIERVQE